MYEGEAVDVPERHNRIMRSRPAKTVIWPIMYIMSTRITVPTAALTRLPLLQRGYPLKYSIAMFNLDGAKLIEAQFERHYNHNDKDDGPHEASATFEDHT